MVGLDQLGVASQHLPQPGALHDEGQPHLLRLGQPQRALQAATTAGTVSGGVVEPGLSQRHLELPEFRVHRAQGAPGGFGVSRGQPCVGERHRGIGSRAGALRRGQRRRRIASRRPGA